MDKDNQTKNANDTTPAHGKVVLVNGHKYKDRGGRIHTLTLVSDEEYLKALMNLLETKMMGFARFGLPRAEPVILKTNIRMVDHETGGDYGIPFFFDFRKGVVGVIEIGQHALTDSYELVEDITKSAPKTKVVRLDELKNGQKFTDAEYPEMGVFTRNTDFPLADSFEAGEHDPEKYTGGIVLSSGQPAWGRKEDLAVIEVEEEVTTPARYPLRLPLVAGRRYINRKGMVSTKSEFWSPYSPDSFSVEYGNSDNWNDRDGRLVDPITGRHEFGKTDYDLVAEADAPESDAKAA